MQWARIIIMIQNETSAFDWSHAVAIKVIIFKRIIELNINEISLLGIVRRRRRCRLRMSKISNFMKVNYNILCVKQKNILRNDRNQKWSSKHQSNIPLYLFTFCKSLFYSFCLLAVALKIATGIALKKDFALIRTLVSIAFAMNEHNET